MRCLDSWCVLHCCDELEVLDSGVVQLPNQPQVAAWFHRTKASKLRKISMCIDQEIVIALCADGVAPLLESLHVMLVNKHAVEVLANAISLGQYPNLNQLTVEDGKRFASGLPLVRSAIVASLKMSKCAV